MPAFSKLLQLARRFPWPSSATSGDGATKASGEHSDRWPLSMPLFSWCDGEVEVFDLSAATCGLHCWGVTGSGKSAGTISAVAHAYLNNGFGAVFLTAKPTDAATYFRYARNCGRESDVVLLGPDRPSSLNFMAEAARGGAGLVANVTSMLSIVSNLALGAQGGGGGGNGGGREDGSFWQRMELQLLSAAAELLMRAGEPVTTINIERLVAALPASREQVGDDAWLRESYLFHCLRGADDCMTDAEDREDLRRLADYFLKQMPSLSDRTRSTVQSSVLSTLDLCNRQVVRRLIGSPAPTFQMDMLLDGKVLIVDMPCLTYGPLARVVQMTIKECFHLAMNRRDIAQNQRPVALFVDEAQLLVDLERDAAFQTTARASRACVVYATQSLSNYLSEHGAASESRTQALLSNLVTQVFHSTTDVKTIEYAQSLFGKRRTLYMNANNQRSTDDWVGQTLGFNNSGGMSAGFSEQLAPLVEAGDFHTLAKGGPQFDWLIEALVYMGGKTFPSTGRPYLPVCFAQERPPGT
ncbi:MAG TPA: TraM recognition domain-containing protein [Phycisphaerales bacterium]|nr:TraM recognition domain-containing protein [Phycisphaerales bacterium]